MKIIWQTMAILVTISIHSISCCKDSKNENLRTIAQDYFSAYQKQDDFQKFLSFYNEQIILEDIINGDRVKGKKALAAFFDWDNPDLSRSESMALVLEDLIVDGNKVVAKGFFTPFQWKNTSFESMHFTTILTFNVQCKIIKQTDWINYPNTLVDYQTRKNANEWINKKE